MIDENGMIEEFIDKMIGMYSVKYVVEFGYEYLENLNSLDWNIVQFKKWVCNEVIENEFNN